MHYEIIVYHWNILCRRKPKTTSFALYTPPCVCVSTVRLAFLFPFRLCSEVGALVWFAIRHRKWKSFFFLPTLAHKSKSTHLHSHCLLFSPHWARLTDMHSSPTPWRSQGGFWLAERDSRLLLCVHVHVADVTPKTNKGVLGFSWSMCHVIKTGQALGF